LFLIAFGFLGVLGEGTGRFNLLHGSIQSAMETGAFLSNSAFGFVAKTADFNASFGDCRALR
jgi:hypothetical protein